MLVSRAFLAWARMPTRLRARWRLLRKPMLVSRAFLANASRMPARLVATTTTRLTMATMTRKRRRGQRQTQSVGWAIRRISMTRAGLRCLWRLNSAWVKRPCVPLHAPTRPRTAHAHQDGGRPREHEAARTGRSLGEGWRMEVPTAKPGLLSHVARWFLV